MNKAEVDLLKKIDFGDIDGLYDPNLGEYFLDFDYSKSIITGDAAFIIGRKGTGKSALYNWIEKKQKDGDVLVANLSFKDFPFEKLLNLSDDQFAVPNQYQTIWRNIILSELACLILKDQKNKPSDEYNILTSYVLYHFGKDIIDLHKEITRKAEKKGCTISFPKIAQGGIENETATDLKDGLSNITLINRRLFEIIEAYLKTNPTSKYIIQFDQLDDNYTVYLNNERYFQAIISLFKAAYDINQTFRSKHIPVKIALYLRSDIYNRIDKFDAESARWDEFRLTLNFSIINRSDWNNPKLLQIINKRIINSLGNFSRNPFGELFRNDKIKLEEFGHIQEPFRYIIHRTFHRPRDVVQFCKKIQAEVKKTDTLYYRTIKDAEKEYSLWLLSELANEIAPVIHDLEALYELLRLMGSNDYSMNDFRSRYSKFKPAIRMEEEELLRELYNFGIIYNVSFSWNRSRQMFSITRNDRSVFNRDLRIMTHSGFYQGLYTSKFTT
ncbi:MAG: P-loop ATPase, Sll1717 family [Candidatus Velamenicoccus archaeovorus]